MLKFQAFGVVTKKFDSDSENEVVTNVGNENNDDKAGKAENVDAFQFELTNFINVGVDDFSHDDVCERT